MTTDVESRVQEDVMQETLRHSDISFAHLVNAVTDYAIFALDLEGRIATWNAGAQRLKGYSEDDVLGKHFSLFYPSEEREKGSPEYGLQIARSAGRFEGEGMRVRKDGTLFWANVIISPILAPEGRLMGFSKVTRDISERKHLEQEREALLQAALDRADRDPLTGLFNHRSFYHHFYNAAEQVKLQELGGDYDHKEASAASSRRRLKFPSSGAFLAVAVFDIDNFKFFNNTYGHLSGDEVLCLVASTLRACCRAGDLIARIGGDEFAILMTGVNREEAAAWVKRLRDTVHALSYVPLGEAAVLPLRLSVGVALYPDEAHTPTEALDIADKRAQQDKNGEDESKSEEIHRLRNALRDEVAGFAILDALVTAVDSKDRYTCRHSEDVMVYASHIAEALGLTLDEKRSLQAAALIHDVGKIAIPLQILRRPGALPPEDFKIMQQHAELGGLLVGAVPELAHALGAVRHHHERWDGGGYPAGLRGEEIPRAARILAVADAYSAMTTDRPYRKGLPMDEAVSRLQAGAGYQWDPVCVDAMLQKMNCEIVR